MALSSPGERGRAPPDQCHVDGVARGPDKDLPFFQDLAIIAANRIPGARRVVIPDVAHMISVEKPEVFNRMLRQFCR
jgi:pimeloyl-ACP methyl ester carboxylesterase